MSTWYQPEKVLVCVRLAGDHQAGLLLYVMMQRYRYAKATLEGTPGRWSANRRTVWFEAAGLSRNQGDRALALLEKLNLIERAHGAWGGKPNVLFIRPTDHTLTVWYAATTFLALDTVLGALQSSPLRELWQAWPDEHPEKAGEIAVWYEQLGGKLTKEIYGKPLNLKPCALDLLQRILESDPTIADTEAKDLRQRLEIALLSIEISEDAEGNLAPFEGAEPSSQM